MNIGILYATIVNTIHVVVNKRHKIVAVNLTIDIKSAEGHLLYKKALLLVS